MRLILLLSFIIFLILPLRADAATCLPQKELVGKILNNGYGWHATAVTEQHYVLQVFINMTTREWLFIMVDNDLNACVVATGYYWGFTLERAI